MIPDFRHRLADQRGDVGRPGPAAGSVHEASVDPSVGDDTVRPARTARSGRPARRRRLDVAPTGEESAVGPASAGRSALSRAVRGGRGLPPPASTARQPAVTEAAAASATSPCGFIGRCESTPGAVTPPRCRPPIAGSRARTSQAGRPAGRVPRHDGRRRRWGRRSRRVDRRGRDDVGRCSVHEHGAQGQPSGRDGVAGARSPSAPASTALPLDGEERMGVGSQRDPARVRPRRRSRPESSASGCTPSGSDSTVTMPPLHHDLDDVDALLTTRSRTAATRGASVDLAAHEPAVPAHGGGRRTPGERCAAQGDSSRGPRSIAPTRGLMASGRRGAHSRRAGGRLPPEGRRDHLLGVLV